MPPAPPTSPSPCRVARELTRVDRPGCVCWLTIPGPLGSNADEAARFIEAIRDPNRGRVLKSDARASVRLVEAPGRSWIIKSRRLPRWRARLSAALGIGPAWSCWRGAQGLAAAGVPTALPLALVHLDNPSQHLLILPYVPGPTLLQLLANLAAIAESRRRSLARAIGRQIGLMTAAGLVNRDHKPSNLVIDPATDQPTVIDTVAIRRRRSDRQVHRMFAVLLRTALRTAPLPPRQCLRCLKAALAADPSIALNRPHGLATVARAVQRAYRRQLPR